MAVDGSATGVLDQFLQMCICCVSGKNTSSYESHFLLLIPLMPSGDRTERSFPDNTNNQEIDCIASSGPLQHGVIVPVTQHTNVQRLLSCHVMSCHVTSFIAPTEQNNCLTLHGLQPPCGVLSTECLPLRVGILPNMPQSCVTLHWAPLRPRKPLRPVVARCSLLVARCLCPESIRRETQISVQLLLAAGVPQCLSYARLTSHRPW